MALNYNFISVIKSFAIEFDGLSAENAAAHYAKG